MKLLRRTLLAFSLVASLGAAFAQEQPAVEPRVVFIADKHDRTREMLPWMASMSHYFEKKGFNLLALECSGEDLPYVLTGRSKPLLGATRTLLRINISALADIAQLFMPFSNVECIDTSAVLITGAFPKVARAFYERELEMASNLMSALERNSRAVVVVGALHAIDGYIFLVSDSEAFSFPSLHSLLIGYGLPPTAVEVLDPLNLTEHFKTFPAITTEEPMNDE